MTFLKLNYKGTGNVNKRKKCNKIISFLLIAVIMVSVITIVAPQEVKAAGNKKFKGKGTSTVTISDNEALDAFRGKHIFIKFKPSVTGYITIKISNYSAYKNTITPYGAITLCKSKTNTISEAGDFNTSKRYSPRSCTRTYGVRKGRTYYFQVLSYGGVKLKATVTAVKKETNSSRAKAKTLKKNTTAKGVLIANENKADWYKIKVTKKQKIKLNYNVKTNNSYDGYDRFGYRIASGIKFTLYKSNGKPFSSGSDNYVLATLSEPTGTSIMSGKQISVSPGIYYIKVERRNKVSSGYYTIKWK